MQMKKHFPTITQIGSLPYDNVKDAIDYSLRHDIPFLPELPKKGESMLEYIKTPGKLSCLKEFKEAVKGYDSVKIQAVGPVTILSDNKSRYTEEEAISKTKEHILRILDGLDAKEIICFLDEPSLETACFGYAPKDMSKEECESLGIRNIDYRRLWDELHDELSEHIDERGLEFGVHTCGNFNWEELFDLNFIDVISFDASKYAQKFVSSNGYRTRKEIAWGVKSKRDVLDFRRGDFLTPPCGLGNLVNTKDCESILENLIKIKKEV
jgi:hypothetical protein